MRRTAIRWLGFALALCLCLTLFVTASPGAAAETEIKKVLVQTGQGGTTPVVWMEVQYLPTATSTKGVSISSAVWYDAGGNPVTTRFEEGTYHLEVRLTANEGYVFAPTVSAFINNSEATCVRESDTSVLLISHNYNPEVWAAAVYKHPTGETVEAGGWASFVTSGGYVQDFEWCLMTPDRQHRFTLKEAKEECQVVSREPLVPKDFINVTYSGEFTDSLILRNIPADMNGWYVYCRLYSYKRLTWTNTNPALIPVLQPSPSPTPEPTPEPSPSPSPEPSPEPSPSPSPEPSPSPSPKPSPTPSPTPSPEPVVNTAWTTDEQFHWHSGGTEGEQAGKAEHDMVWTVTRPAAIGASGEEEGECSVCGYKTTREIPPLEPEKSGAAFDGSFGISPNAFRFIVYGIFGAMGAGLIALIVMAAVKRNRRR